MHGGENIPPTPRTHNRQLKSQLEQAVKIREEEKVASETERLSHMKEIGRLRHEVRQLKGPKLGAGAGAGTGPMGSAAGSLIGGIPIVGYAVSSFTRLLVPYPTPTTQAGVAGASVQTV